MTESNTHLIRQLNDEFRSRARDGWLFTRGVRAEGSDFVAAALAAVVSFNAFTPDNDPYGEHDFGAVTVYGHKLFWKIDYYDAQLCGCSPDPADDDVTRRVLTVMLASEW